MKIEMGESLVYSWLRHVKECQIVQMNWKMSPMWDLHHGSELQTLMSTVDNHFHRKHSYNIFKKNAALSQLLQQGECDAIGIHATAAGMDVVAVDVAFHENGLQYGALNVTAMKVVEKCVRTAFIIYGTLDTKAAEIIFASPKIGKKLLEKIEPCIRDLNQIFKNKGFEFKFSLYANEDFNELLLSRVLRMSTEVSDTAELFLRSYQMCQIYAKNEKATKKDGKDKTEGKKKAKDAAPIDNELPELKGMKIGKVANIVLREMLMDGSVTKQEVKQMQDSTYSKKTFGIQYPLLVPCNGEKMAKHYYARPIKIGRKSYQLCNEWCEKVGGNNDRPYLLAWIKAHKRIEEH